MPLEVNLPSVRRKEGGAIFVRLMTGLLGVSSDGSLGLSSNDQVFLPGYLEPARAVRVKGLSRVEKMTWGTRQPAEVSAGAGAATTALGTRAARARVRAPRDFILHEWRIRVEV